MSAAIKWGLITGMVYVLSSLLSTLMGAENTVGIGWLINIIVFGITLFMTYMGLKETRDNEREGYLTFGEGFKTGMKIALVAGVVAGVFALLNLLVINPDFMDEIMAAQEDQMEGASDEQIEMTNKIMGFMRNPYLMAVMSLLYVVFWGVFKSLIASAIVKKDPPPTIPAV
jgi:hypothetical protein